MIAWLLITIILFTLFHFIPFREPERKEEKKTSLSFVRPGKREHPFTRKDFFLCSLITLIFAFPAFWKLGSTVLPHTTWQPSSAEETQSFTLKLTEETSFTAIYTICGEGDNNALSSGYQLGTNGTILYGSSDGISFEEITVLDTGKINEYTITRGDWDYRYIRVCSVNAKDTLTEIGFYNETEEQFLPAEVYEDAYSSGSYPAELVIDEQDLLTAVPTYYDEGYFDEIYHVRNAAEIAAGQDMYATVHPLLGTNLIALSIRIFGMCPFAWRLPGTLFSIAMIPLMYALLHLLFSNTCASCTGAAVTAFDFMHMTTGRIATLEPCSVFFILLMFFWMVRYARTSFYDTPFGTQMRYLLFSGISMGLAISSKWTGCYSAVGLAVILFTNLTARTIEYIKAFKLLKTNELTVSQKEEAEQIVSGFRKYMTATICLCFLFFIFIPACIYWLCYLPDRVWKGSGWSAANVWAQNVSMYHYHTTLNATHPYQSQWYQWLLDLRPIWYYYGTDQNNFVHTIACFSNPLLTWAGLPAVIYTGYRAVIKKDMNAWMITAGYLTALGPWISLVQRCVFSYHFYPASLFTSMAIAYAASKISRTKYGKYIIAGFLCAYFLNFVIYLPVTAGFGTSSAYIKALEILKGWYFG